MFPRFSEVVAAIEDLRAQGIIRDYAIGGAFAQAIWDEVTTTFDLDVFVLLPGSGGPLVDLGPIYRWAEERGYQQISSHLKISGVPVQFVPAPDALAEEAIEKGQERRIAPGDNERRKPLPSRDRERQIVVAVDSFPPPRMRRPYEDERQADGERRETRGIHRARVGQ